MYDSYTPEEKSITERLTAPDDAHPAWEDVNTGLVVENTGDLPILVSPFLDGQIQLDGRRTRISISDVPIVDHGHPQRVEPGQKAVLPVTIRPMLYYLPKCQGVRSVSIAIKGRLFLPHEGTDSYDTIHFNTSPIDLILDFSAVKNIPWVEGSSEFFLVAGNVYHADDYVRGENKTTLVPLKLRSDKVRALNAVIACDDDVLYWGEYRQIRPVRDTLQGMGRVFYGDQDGIWTTYGNAKIADPASFEALLPAGPSRYCNSASGYQCGYGRDANQAYYFDEATSTKHASVIRACKAPDELEVVGGVYARDRKNVYAEGRILKGADAASFERLNAKFARDKNGIWYVGCLVIKSEDLLEPVELMQQDWSNWGEDPMEASELLRVGMQVYDASIRKDDRWRDLRSEDLVLD